MFRLGARKILRYPGVSAITFLTLAIGIAVSATIFAVTWSTLVRPFPFRDQERLVQFWVNDPKGRPLEEVRAIRDEIARRVEDLVGGLDAAG